MLRTAGSLKVGDVVRVFGDPGWVVAYRDVVQVRLVPQKGGDGIVVSHDFEVKIPEAEIAKRADALAGAFRQARLVRAVWPNYPRNQVWVNGRQMNGRRSPRSR